MNLIIGANEPYMYYSITQIIIISKNCPYDKTTPNQPSSESQYTLILICSNLTNIFSHLFLFPHLSLAHLVLQRQGVLEDKNNKKIWNMMKTRNEEQHKPKTIRSNCAQTVLTQPSRSCQNKPASAWRFIFLV